MDKKILKKGFCVILHNIRSNYNVGSIFRSADAIGVEKIFLCGWTPSPDKNSAISKTALGAENFVPWEKFWQTHLLIERLKKEGFQIVALEQGSRSIYLSKFKPTFPMALIVGNEVKGLSKKMIEKVDEIVEIPMLGKKESLNVSVAFGIASYSIMNKK